MMKTWTLRVDDIPLSGTDVDTLTLDLRTIVTRDSELASDVPVDDVRVRSLVPWDESTLCATVCFRTLLKADDLCHRLNQSRAGFPFTFASDFKGITPLHVDPAGADVDIIAVPGLGCNALGSWRDTATDNVWLRDFLPTKLPNIRVLLYGYDTTLENSLWKQPIADLGSALLEQIIAFRAQDETSTRPIIFIGHSLGGLLIKEALVLARRKHTQSVENSQLSDACYGLLLFGVPNLGLRHQQLMALVRGQPNQSLIRDLVVDSDSEPSPFLKKLADQFSETCRGRHKVVTFYERRLSPTLKRGPDGEWKRTGPPCLMVTEKSATSTGLVAAAEEDNIPLDADHSKLVKYGSQRHENFTVVRERIRRLVGEAKVEVKRRFAEHNLSQPQSNLTDACLRSLAFSGMDDRENGIDDAADGTCRWLLDHQTFVNWTSQSRGLLWFKGKPGSGKSTLMSYATRHAPRLYGTDTRVISFFFHGRGNELQKSLLGLFRSLLHQLLKHLPGAVFELTDYFDEKTRTVGKYGEEWQWKVRPLQRFLQDSLPRILDRFPVILFVDALDECGEEAAVELIEYLKGLLKNLPTTVAHMGILFSCRHYPILHLDEGLTIVLETENTRDIDTYVKARLSGRDSNIRGKIQQLISILARGVFMWAHLVVDRVLRLSRQGASLVALEAEVKRTPEKLEDLYRELLGNAENRTQTLRLMQWICFSIKPLSPRELQWAMAIDPEGACASLAECQASDEFITEDQISNRVNTLSCGLAEIVSSKDPRAKLDSQTVQVIHQSVKDFFLSGLSLLVPVQPADQSVRAIHCQIATTCVQYLKLVFQVHPEPLSDTDLENFPFVDFAVTSSIAHLKLAELEGSSCQDFIDLFEFNDPLLDFWVMTLTTFRPGYLNVGMRLVHIFAFYGLANMLSRVLSGNDDFTGNIQDSNRRTPLCWAAIEGQEGCVKTLLDTGQVDVDVKDKCGRTPLSWAARAGYEGIMKILLDIGKVDVDIKDNDGWTPLSWAAGNGHEGVVKILLDTGQVDVDVKDKYGRTPLSWAARAGYEGVVKILLDTGQVDVDVKDNRGRTPLSWAAGHSYEGVVKILLDTGKVDVDVKDNHGRTPLLWAAGAGYEGIVKILLDTGQVDVNAKDNRGRTPLLWVARAGYEGIVKILLDTGQVDVNDALMDGRTALWLAVNGGHVAVVKLLLSIPGINAVAVDARGRTAFQREEMHTDEEIYRLLLAYNTPAVEDLELTDRRLR